jgi:CubicO group peptidase (beta-lactamase class C family)
MDNIIGDLAEKVKDLPDQTQLAVGLIKGGSVNYYGLIKDNLFINEIENSGSVFEVGSVTKVFTANLLARMVVNGDVALDDPISKFLPFKLKSEPVITVGQLVSHTSGLPRLPQDFFSYPEYSEDNPYFNYTEERLIYYLSNNLVLENTPGTKCNYSNLGFGVLSYILSVIKGLPFARLMQEQVFEIIGMRNTGFSIDAVTKTFVKGLDKDGITTTQWDGGVLNGCVGAVSTVADLARFAVQLLNTKSEGNTIQLKELAELRTGVNICMAWATSLLRPQIYWHGGGTAGSGCIFAFSIEKQTAIIVLSNIEPHTFKTAIEPYAFELMSDM